jgi:hypothetical protein
MKQKITLKVKKKQLRKQINGKFKNTGSADENKIKNIIAPISSSVIQLKPISDIFLRGFGLSSCPQHSLKVLFL